MQNIITLGADPTGVAFSDAAIASAIAAGQGVYMPSGTYRVKTTQLMTIPQTVMGDGATTIILLDVAMPAGANLFHVTPVPQPSSWPWPRGFNFRHFQVVPQAAGLGSAILFDTTGPGWQLAGSVVEDISVWQMGGPAIASVNSNANGPWSVKIRDCLLQGGLSLSKLGDTCAIEDCDITGNGVGIAATFATGASSLVIKGCNITSKGGAIWLYGAIGVAIEDTECECPGGYAPSIPGLIYIQNSSVVTMSRVKVNAETLTNAIRLSGSNACQVTRSFLTATAPYFHITDGEPAGFNEWGDNEYLDGASGLGTGGYIHTGS